MVQFEQLFDPMKETFFKNSLLAKVANFRGKSNFFARQAIAKFFSPYTLPVQGSILTMCRSIPNLFHVEHFPDPDEKDLF